jgi:hypothetical protein
MTRTKDAVQPVQDGPYSRLIPLPESLKDREEYRKGLEARLKQLRTHGVRGQQPGDIEQAEEQLRRLAAKDAVLPVPVKDAGQTKTVECPNCGKRVSASSNKAGDLYCNKHANVAGGVCSGSNRVAQFGRPKKSYDGRKIG